MLCTKAGFFSGNSAQLVELNSFPQNHWVFLKLKAISPGVPQGSVLGHLLFVLHVSDLPSSAVSTSSSCAMFADDRLLYNTSCSAPASSSSSKPRCLIQDDATSIQSWADEWNTLFNAKKSSHMVISRSSLQSYSPSITLHGEPQVLYFRHKYSSSWPYFHPPLMVCSCSVYCVS